MSGILYRLRTGCQWDAIPAEFGSRSTCYRRLVEWTQEGVFRMMHLEMLLYYDEERGIEWAWASLASASVKAPAGTVARRTSASTRVTTMTTQRLLFARAASSLTFDAAGRESTQV